MAKKSKCRFWITRPLYGDNFLSFPFSEKGWNDAVAKARQMSSEDREHPKWGLAVSCDGEVGEAQISLIGCTNKTCDPESPMYGIANTHVLASGTVDKPKKVKKPRRKVPKSQQTPAQRRFAEAAASCKGTPGKGGYRACMARTLGKK